MNDDAISLNFIALLSVPLLLVVFWSQPVSVRSVSLTFGNNIEIKSAQQVPDNQIALRAGQYAISQHDLKQKVHDEYLEKIHQHDDTLSDAEKSSLRNEARNEVTDRLMENLLLYAGANSRRTRMNRSEVNSRLESLAQKRGWSQRRLRHAKTEDSSIYAIVKQKLMIHNYLDQEIGNIEPSEQRVIPLEG